MSDLVGHIETGLYDDEIEVLLEAVVQRRKELRRERAHSILEDLNPGDTIQFTRPITPQYLVGVRATVQYVDRYNAKAVVDVEDRPGTGRFRGARSVKVPGSCIKVVARAGEAKAS